MMSNDLTGFIRINIEISKDKPLKTEIICDGDNAVIIPCAIIAIVECFSTIDRASKDHIASYALIHELAKEFGYEVKKK